MWHIFEREYIPVLQRGEAKGGLEEEVRKKGKPDLRKKVMLAVIVRQWKPWHKKDGIYMYFEDNARVIVNPKGVRRRSRVLKAILDDG